VALLLPALCGCHAPTARGQPAPLTLERTIVLTDVAGRIDHLAVDVAGRRLFVAELGNGTVDAIDLDSGAVVGRIKGLPEPQGMAFLPDRAELAVANGGDGSLRFFRAADLAPTGSVALGEDADNVRLDPHTGRLLVGYGSGALAVVDPATRQVVRKTPLPAHPEGFQLDGDRAYVNLPDAGRIGVADTATGALLGSWPNAGLRFNYPLAVDRAAGVVATVYRLPAKLAIFDIGAGTRLHVLDTCGDADDLFFDGKRHRLYVICGAGSVDVFEVSGRSYRHVPARIDSRRGARTGLFVPEQDRLYVAALPGPISGDAAILVFRPAP
jgi:DNA-binding beta-propeller fold protein YncE